jgi:hypothetical protein
MPVFLIFFARKATTVVLFFDFFYRKFDVFRSRPSGTGIYKDESVRGFDFIDYVNLLIVSKLTFY